MRETVSFLKQSLVRFREMGSLVPSSPQLARAMVAEVPVLPASEVIVELGPGTGVFTRELVARFPRNRVVAVEFNSRFAERLALRMPEIDVVEGCASLLPEHLAELGIPTERVGAVVSGLPLLSLPRELGSAIFAGITRTLAPGRRYIQFTYSKRAWRDATPAGFRLDKTRMVWLNFPPAEILPFTRVRSRAEVCVA